MKQMRDKVFLDTNVVLDLLLPERNSYYVSAILTAIKQHRLEGQMSTQSILDAKYASRKQQVSQEDFAAFYQDLRRYINFGSVDPQDVDWAFEHYSGDLEDDAQYASAYDACCDFFITRDRKLQERNTPMCPMTVITPEEFVARMTEA